MPNTDLLQILLCPNDHEECGYCPDLKLYWQDSMSLKPMDCSKLFLRPQEHSSFLPRLCRLTPEAVQEYPCVTELSEAQIKKLEDWQVDGSSLYQHSLSVAPGVKIGGYPHWVQDPEVPICKCRRRMTYLLTIDSTEFDGGTYKRWLPESERQVWSSHHEVRRKVQNATGIMLGDMGCINVFVCSVCSPWRCRWIFQCS